MAVTYFVMRSACEYQEYLTVTLGFALQYEYFYYYYNTASVSKGESNTGSSPGGKSYLPTKGSSGAFGSTTSSLRFQVNYYATYYYYYGSIFILMNEVEDAFLGYCDFIIATTCHYYYELFNIFPVNMLSSYIFTMVVLGYAIMVARSAFEPVLAFADMLADTFVIFMDALFVDALKYANEPLDNVEQKDGPFDNMVLMALLNTPLLETPAPRGLLRGGADHARGTEHWPSAQHRSGQLVDCRRTGGENRGLSPGDRTCEGAGAGGCETT